MVVVAMFLGFFVIAIAAVAWILADDTKKRRNARRMRPRDRDMDAAASPQSPAIMARASSGSENSSSPNGSNLSQGAA